MNRFLAMGGAGLLTRSRHFGNHPPMKRTSALIAILAILAAAGCSSSAKTDAPTGTTPKSNQPSKGITAKGSTDPIHEVAITKCAEDPTLHLLSIKGTAKNDTSKRSDFIIELAVTDASGATQIESTTAIASNVEPGQTALWDGFSTTDYKPGLKCKVLTVSRTASV